MSNIVTATIEFSFKGQVLTPSVTIDLDEFLLRDGCLPNLYAFIATENNYDLYSYEYEMMQAEPITFSHAEGRVAEFISHGSLDIPAFEAAWNANLVLQKLQTIASEVMGIDDLSEHPKLQQVLLAAYQLGKQDNA